MLTTKVNKPTIKLPPGSVRLPDEPTSKYVNRFTYPSMTSNAEYVIGQHAERRHWSCGCMAYRFPRDGRPRGCKHLRSLGLPEGERPFECYLGSDQPENVRAAGGFTTCPQCGYCEEPKPVPESGAAGGRPRRRFSLDADI